MKLTLTSVLALALGLSTLPALPSVARAEVKVGVVDLQRALNETDDGRKAKAKLKTLFKKRQDTLDKQQNSLKTMKDDIEKQKDVISRDALKEKLEGYQKSFVELQTTYVEFQRELAQKEGQLTKGILEKMQKLVQEIGQSKGITVVVERTEGGVVWASSSLDLTEELIKKYNQQAPKSAAEPASAKSTTKSATK